MNLTFVVVGLFVLVWAAAIAYWKLAKLDHHWAPSAQAAAARSEPGSGS